MSRTTNSTSMLHAKCSRDENDGDGLLYLSFLESRADGDEATEIYIYTRARRTNDKRASRRV